MQKSRPEARRAAFPATTAQAAGLLVLRRVFAPALLRFCVATGGCGAWEALDCAHAAIGLAIHNNDSNLAGVFMAFLGAAVGWFYAKYQSQDGARMNHARRDAGDLAVSQPAALPSDRR